MPKPAAYLKWLAVEPGTCELRIDHTWPAAVAQGPGTLACSPDGALVATVGPDGGCALWERRTGTFVRWLARGVTILQVAFHPDGERLFLATDRGAELLVADLATGVTRTSWAVAVGITAPVGSPDHVRAIRVGAGGRLLALEVGFTDFGAESWTTQRVLVVWDVAAERALWHLHDETAGAWSDFEVSLDEQTVLVVQGQARVPHDARTGQVRVALAQAAATPPPAVGAGVVWACTSPCGRFALAVAGEPWRRPPTGWRVVAIADGATVVALHTRRCDRWLVQQQFAAGGDILLLATSDGLLLHGTLVPRTRLEPAIARPDQATGLAPTLGG